MMACWTILCASSLLVAVHAQWNVPYPTRYEGEVCRYVEGEPWTCQKARECSVLSKLMYSRALETCYWSGSTHVVCCPQSAHIIRARGPGISEKKCQEYQRTACSKRYVRSQEKRDLGAGDYMGENLPANEEIPDVGIYGGIKANPAEFPHSALIGYGGDSCANRGKIKWSCGGSLVSEKFVLSAAHCADSFDSGKAQWVLLGDVDYGTNTEEADPQCFKIISHHVHKGYKEPALYNDIALFKLDRSVTFSKFVAPACLYTSYSNPTGQGTAVGWGITGANRARSSAMMKVNLTFVPFQECNKTLTNLFGASRGKLPTGVSKETMVCGFQMDKTMCEGDSGSGIVLPDKGKECLHRLVGVLSFSGDKCVRHKIPSGFTRVASYIKWIEKTVWN